MIFYVWPSMWTFIQIFKIAFTPARDKGKTG